MNIDQLTNPNVKAAVQAMNDGNRAAWLSQFTSNPILTDDDNPRDFVAWSDSELFGKSRGWIAEIDKVEEEENSLLLYAKFHSDKWGDFKTTMKFTIRDNKISRLDVAQADY